MQSRDSVDACGEARLRVKQKQTVCLFERSGYLEQYMCIISLYLRRNLALTDESRKVTRP